MGSLTLAAAKAAKELERKRWAGLGGNPVDPPIDKIARTAQLLMARTLKTEPGKQSSMFFDKAEYNAFKRKLGTTREGDAQRLYAKWKEGR